MALKELQQEVKDSVIKNVNELKGYKMQEANIKLMEEDGDDIIKVNMLFVKTSTKTKD
jgi:hypothetical protein